MKLRISSLVVIGSLLLSTFFATPTAADTGTGNNRTDFAGTADFVSWTDITPPEVKGNNTHVYVFTEWSFATTDARVSGVYALTGKCMWPDSRPLPWGPCSGTWTLDVNGDQAPDWTGTFAIGGQTYHTVWNGVGHGLGPYAGLHMSFNVYQIEPSPYRVTGQIHGS